MEGEQNLGDAVREYVQRKFGEYEAGQLVLSHESLRYVIASFTIEWITTHPARGDNKNEILQGLRQIKP